MSDSDWIKFLGTAGARFVMIKQLRSSAGLWLHLKEKDIILDPGPGSLLRCSKARPRLEPTKLDACILTHRHLDHSNDINVMIEAMTQGGFKKKGAVFAPRDCLENDGVIFKYLQAFPERIEILKEGRNYRLGELLFSTPIKNLHNVDTFGMVFQLNRLRLSIISDTAFFKELVDAYKADIVVLNLVFFQRRDEYQHLCLEDAEKIIKGIKPKLSLITHFGMTILKNDPRKIALALQETTGRRVIACYDGFTLDLEKI